MAHEVKWADDRVDITYRGRVTVEDARATDQAVIGSPHFDRVTGVLVDLSDVEDMAISPTNAVANAFVDNAARRSKDMCKVAYVITSDAPRRHVSLHNETLRRLGFSWPIGHFDNRDAAIAWLQERRA